MTDPNAVSSDDRVRLRELARRLRPEEGPPPPLPPPPATDGGYVRLRAEPVTSDPLAVRPPLPPAPEDVGGSAGWARLLAWCIAAVGAESAILTDDRGLVIASAGVIDLDLAQGIAARLVIAFHQADRMGAAPSPAMAIQLDAGWLTGLRIEHGGEPLTLGALARQPLDERARRAVFQALTRKLHDG